MPTSQMSEVIQHLRRAVLVRDGAGLTDGQLLSDYLGRRDEAALAALVRRHGPMVWGVCRRALRNYHDAEDAFQATFLVLVRKAASIASRELLANWLYGVAYQTGLKARATAARRGARERQVTNMPEAGVIEQDLWHDVLPLLDQELSRLPDKYRVPIVLCDLEGKTRREAARQLGCPEGTVAGRLARARVLLAKRLARHGVTVAGGALAAVLSQNAASACVPAAVVSGTIQAATLFAAGPAAAADVLSAKVVALTQGVLKTMFLTKLKIATAVLLAVSAFATGAGWLTHQALADKPTDKVVPDAGKKDSTEVSGVVKAVDPARNTLLVQRGKDAPGEETFSLAGDAKVFLDDATGDKLGFHAGKLADVTEGTHVTLRLTADRKVTRILAEGPTVQGTLKAVDATNHTVTVTITTVKGEAAADKTFAVAKNVKLFIDDGKPHDKSQPAQQPSLADLPAMAVVTLKLSADRKVVGNIRAEGRTVTGVLKAVDGTRNTITVTISAKGEADVERTFPVAKAAQVSIDDGKPKDKSKPAEAQGVADLPVGAQVTLRLALDQQSVVGIRAEGVNVYATVKAVDAAKRTLTVHDKVRGEQTYHVMADAVVLLDGKGEPRKLADVPVDAAVDVKLLPDQKTVREIRAHGPTVLGSVVGTAGNDSVTLHNKEGDKTFTVGKHVRIVLDENRAGKLTDLIDGTVVRLRLSVDKTTVLDLHAEGPSFRGIVKAFDPDKDMITLTIGGKGGVGGEDKEFKLTRNTVVRTGINGALLKLTDIRAEKEVILRLSIDQKVAVWISVLGE
jgi:RNA polymerase sigma factor (sigma-70 family)